MFLTQNTLKSSQHLRLSAWLEHGPFAFWLMQQLQPENVVELGTHHGFSFLSLCQAAKQNNLTSHIYAVDTWRGDAHAGFYGDEIFDTLEAEVQRDYPQTGFLIRSTFQEARSQFADGTIDLLHIDGRHRYEDVLEDFETWRGTLSNRGVILFHDTQVQTQDFGVWKLWADIAKDYPSFEFHHGNGLGVLVVGKNAPAPIMALCAAGPEDAALTRSLYARLGLINSIEYQLTFGPQNLKELEEQCHLLTEDRDRVARASELKDTRLAALQIERDEACARASQLDALIEQMRSSSSWRLTKGYRWAGHQLRRARHVAKVATSLIRRHGGLGRAASRLIAKLRREGPQGIFSTWRRAQEIAAVSMPIDSGDGQVYLEWLAKYASLDDDGRQAIRQEIAGWHNRPLISIVMPVYNPPLELLQQAVESVKAQLYPHWELCIADDKSTDREVRKYLKQLRATDDRIKVTFRRVNGHISEASNTAIDMATGEWIALLDQDDLLTQDALFYVAREILGREDVKLIYSDEDKFDGVKRYDPYFKPDWNPDLLRSCNYVCHLGVYRRDRIREIGGFRKGLEGSQDHDLVLRFSEGLTPGEIAHIPRVLYHWRSHSGSTAQSASNKSYAVRAGQRAIQDHLKRLSVPGTVEILPTSMYRVRYSLPDVLPLVTIVIPTRNGVDLLRQCIDSIRTKTSYANYEILIVDNNSDDPRTMAYFAQVQAQANVKVVRDERPFNYSQLNNSAVRTASGAFIVLMNNDIEVISEDWLSEMMGIAIQKGVGVVGARLWYPDNRLQHGGVILGIGGVAGHSHKYLPKGGPSYFSRGDLIQSLTAVTAACLLVRKSIYEEVGGLDEERLKVAFNDVDFCIRVREAGYRNVWTPYAELYHHESATRGHEDTPEKMRRFQGEAEYMLGRWKHILNRDPAYNPNLTLEHEDFSLAWPPRNEGDPTLAS
ncbi:Glycosyltransferase, GT2 family [Rhizobium sp. RU35A]|uniref:glycosyltransferase family 2 protein n=1 Tax=Rhizobium sp. RU35A TaxID=1907414 RepID=UPI0009547743|nr:Glycosyltransferase, GT2 family [Rhizobium sp. RU35A]